MVEGIDIDVFQNKTTNGPEYFYLDTIHITVNNFINQKEFESYNDNNDQNKLENINDGNVKDSFNKNQENKRINKINNNDEENFLKNMDCGKRNFRTKERGSDNDNYKNNLVTDLEINIDIG